MPEFMMLFRGGEIEGSSPEQSQKIVEEYIGWVGRLQKQGIYKAGDELQRNGRVVSVADGKTVDGPFTETKESVGGYFLIDVENYDRAVEISKECPSLKNGGIVEIRQIWDHT